MNEIIDNSFFIKDLVNQAQKLALELKEIIQNIKDQFSDIDIKLFLCKFDQNQKAAKYLSYWDIIIDEVEFLLELNYSCWGEYNTEYIDLKYLLDEQELKNYIDKINKDIEDKKLTDAKYFEDKERETLRRLKEKYNA